MTPSFLVGTPVWKRGWVLPQWLEAVEVAAEVAGVEPTYVFVGDPRDKDSFAVVDAFADSCDREVYISWVEESSDTPDERKWNSDRYHRMVYIRNILLKLVREIQPDLFLSLDSDILLHPCVIEDLIESSEQFDLVGGKTYMTPTGRQFPSYGFMPGLRRADESSVFATDVVMAIKMMTPAAYAVDYEYHDFGEDIGFCLACKQKGISIGFDGRATSKHVMSPGQLDVIDERCGF